MQKTGSMLHKFAQSRAFRMARFRLGRGLLHLGLKTLPPGVVRTELSNLLWAWGIKVSATVIARNTTHHG